MCGIEKKVGKRGAPGCPGLLSTFLGNVLLIVSEEFKYFDGRF
jgi:hypothetical protein